ncbi:hypothetical protein V6N13_062092 [Hibiscus sabdariffa]|uniref:Uncharacterized protein n=2 Tax=Hibiscus sabdariffa TaxID=183260 RepID=A0ABR1ZUI8_9ROSI
MRPEEEHRVNVGAGFSSVITLAGLVNMRLLRLLRCPVCLFATGALFIALCDVWLTPPWEFLLPFVQLRFGLLFAVFSNHIWLGLCALSDPARCDPLINEHPRDSPVVVGYPRWRDLASLYAWSSAPLLGIFLLRPDGHVPSMMHACMHTPVWLVCRCSPTDRVLMLALATLCTAARRPRVSLDLLNNARSLAMLCARFATCQAASGLMGATPGYCCPLIVNRDVDCMPLETSVAMSTTSPTAPGLSRSAPACARRLPMSALPEHQEFDAWYAAQTSPASVGRTGQPASVQPLAPAVPPPRAPKRHASHSDPPRPRPSSSASRIPSVPKAGMSNANNSSAETAR